VGRQYPCHQMELVLRWVHQILGETDGFRTCSHIREYSSTDWIQFGRDIDGRLPGEIRVGHPVLSLSSDGTRYYGAMMGVMGNWR
jgi:hypothetical protein